MIELKAFNMPRYAGQFTTHEVYLKSEVDKVIADLVESHNKDVEQLLMEIVKLKDKALQYKVLDKEHCRDLNTQERFFAKQIAHQKHKRCLAMAKACEAKSERMYCEAFFAKTQNEIIGNEPKDAVVEKFELWGAIASTHRKRWLELAEKFKPNKSTAQ